MKTTLARQEEILALVSGHSFQVSKTGKEYVRLEFDAYNSKVNVLHTSVEFFKSIKSKWVRNNPVVITVNENVAGKTHYIDSDGELVVHTEDGLHLDNLRNATLRTISVYRSILSEEDIVDLKSAIEETVRVQRAISF